MHNVVKILQRMLLVLSSLALCLLCLEAGFRLIPRYRFESMSYNVGASYDPGWGITYRASELFGYELIPRSLPGVNSLGMRDREYSAQKAAGVFRVLVIGDSVTQLGRWSDYVEDKLNAGGGKYELLNCGVCAWGLYQYWAYLQHYGMRYGADMVLIGFCLNDISEYSQVGVVVTSRRTGMAERFTPVIRVGSETARIMAVNPFLFKHSSLYRASISMLLALRNKYTLLNRQTPEGMLGDIRRFTGGKVRGIIFPYLKPLDDYTPWEMQQYRQTRELLEKNGIAYLDLTGSFAGYGKDIVRFRDRPADQIHYNDEANRIKADIIYDWLKAAVPD